MAENCLAGNPSSQWDLNSSGAGDSSIQGFATDISVNQGGTIYFKINTPAKAYAIDIYRMGYYSGNGARKIVRITPSATLPQTQPACLTDSTTGLYDCGNWAVSASWQVPATATSGIYFAHLIRTDSGGDSHIVFVVRNDASHSNMLFQTADETWQAYNYYGGGSVYGPASATFSLGQRASKVSYNRPFLTRGFQDESASWVFGAEYPMVRFLEANGYDVTYFTGVDAARNGSLITNHKIYLTSGHDEYWSGPHRTNVEAARDAGVNMAFFAGNEVFWKTRWENSIDGTNTAYRTLVCYKETLAFAKTDPADPPTWTGTWRDPSFSPPADGGRPENSLTGTLFMVNGPGSDNTGNQQIKVPAADGKMRFWRNTAVASLANGSTYTLPTGTLGYEWDVDPDNGARPAGAFELSTSTYNLTSDLLLDFGATYGAGTATHHMVMYRAPSGALVFGSGTVQWSWGLDSNHDNPFGFTNPNPDPNMQQATVNLFADMGVQPATLQAGLLAASASTDKTAPASVITSPAPGSTLNVGIPASISGTASDSGGGTVGGVEVSTDNGNTWHPATGRGSWSYTFTPAVVGSTNLRSRAVDDSGNLETPSAGVAATIAEHDCPCTAWLSNPTPSTPDSGDGSSTEVGVKFRSDYNGYVTGVRFYKSSANSGTHVGNLWSSSGTLLASATFTNETASGWQQVSFSSPVAITANTTYIASYFAPSGHYAAQTESFATAGIDDPPIHLLRSGVDGPNGVYSYGSHSSFPNSSYAASNYWVDVVFYPSGSMNGAPPALAAAPTQLSFNAYINSANPPSQSVSVYNQGTTALNWTASASASWIVLGSSSGTTPQNLAISVNASGLAAGTYSGTVSITASGAANSPQTIAVTIVVTNLLLGTNFASQGLQGWLASPLGALANWSIVNSAAQYNGSGVSQIYAGNSAWTNYTATAQFKLSSALNYPGGLRGRINPSTGAGYMVWVYPQSGQIILFRASAWDINQPLTQLGAATASFDTTSYHSLSLAFSGTSIQVLYDGKSLISTTDSTYANGLVALEGDSQVISFGSVVVTSGTANSDTLTPSASSLSFTAAYGGPSPAPQSSQLTAASGALTWTATSNATWMSVSPAGGLTTGTLQVAVSPAGLAGGTYSGTVSLVALGAVNATQSINVTFTVTTPPPAIAVSPAGLTFNATTGTTPAAQTVNVLNSGYGSFNWTVTSDSAWLTPSPSSGSTPGSVAASVSVSGLAVGAYKGNLIISASGVANSPFSVPVTLNVFSPDMNESFADNALGWIISPMGGASGWTVNSGIYTYSGGPASQSCTGNTGWTDYSTDVNVKLSNLSNWPGGIRARVNPSTGAGYAVWLYPGSGLVILYKVGQWDMNGAQLTALGQAPLSFDTNTHDLRLTMTGSTLAVAWDGSTLITATDATYTTGYVCLDADTQPISYSNVRVNAVQSALTLSVTPSSLVFSASPNSSPAPQTVNVTTPGGVATWALKSSASWLTATPSSVYTPGSIAVSANPSGLAEGTYSATITLSAPAASGSPVTIPVTFAVKTALLAVAPSSLAFFGTATSSPGSQVLQITNAGSGSLSWSASATSSWLQLSSTSGTAPASVSVQPNTTGLATGSYSDAVTVTSGDVANSPATIPVSLQVGTLLFSDNFSNGAGNWTISPLGYSAGWSVSNGTYNFNGSGHTQSWAGYSTWGNYTAAVNFQLASLNDYPGGMRGRLNTSTGAGYAVWIYPAEHILKLYKVGQWNIDEGYTLLAQSGSVPLDTNVHTLRMVFQGSTIQVYLDNTLQITTSDSTYTQGAIALDVSNQPISFSNVSVIGF